MINRRRWGLVCVLACMMGVSALCVPPAARAGALKVTLADENFSGRSVDAANWYIADQTGLSFPSSEAPVLRVQGPYAGTSLTSVERAEGGFVAEIDIRQIDYGPRSGWFGLAYNLKNLNDGAFLEAKESSATADGIYFQYHYEAQKIVFATFRGHLTSFVDGAGNAIPQRTQWKFYDASALADEDCAYRITNKTLSFRFGSGGVEIRMKELGTEGEGEVIIRNAPGANSMCEVSDQSLVSLGFVDGHDLIRNAEVSDFRLYSADKSRLYNEFSEANLGNYSLYAPANTKLAFFGFQSSLRFGGDYDVENPLILAKKVTLNDPDDSYGGALELETVMDIRQIGEGARFGIATGFSYRSSGQVGEAESSFLYFVKGSGTLRYGAESYGQDGRAETLSELREVPSGSEGRVTLLVTITNRGKLTVSFDGRADFTSEEGKAYAEGYAAYALDGEGSVLDVELVKVRAVNSYYDRPANKDILTTFDDNEYNTNDWFLYSKPYLDNYANGIYVKDGELVFDNVAMNSGMATVQKFGNAEVSFDITGLRREPEYDSAGNHIYPISSFIGVFFGAQEQYVDFGKIGNRLPLIYISADVDEQTWDRKKDAQGRNLPVRVYAMGNGLNQSFPLPARYDIWDPSREGETLTMKVTVVDETVSVAVKYDFDTQWYEVCRMEMLGGVSGHINICGMGNNYFVEDISEGSSCGNFTLDRLSVRNLDDSPARTEYGFSSNKKEPSVDYPYADRGDDEEYLIRDMNAKGCASSGSASAVLALAGAALLRLWKRGE